jgi:hypothetical protein
MEGNRGFVGLHSAEGYFVVTVFGFLVLAAIFVGAFYMRRAMAMEKVQRLKMKADLEAKSAETPKA